MIIKSYVNVGGWNFAELSLGQNWYEHPGNGARLGFLQRRQLSENQRGKRIRIQSALTQLILHVLHHRQEVMAGRQS